MNNLKIKTSIKVIKIPLDMIYETSNDRPEGYVDNVLGKSIKITDNYVYLKEKDYVDLINEYNGTQEVYSDALKIDVDSDCNCKRSLRKK